MKTQVGLLSAEAQACTSCTPLQARMPNQKSVLLSQELAAARSAAGEASKAAAADASQELAALRTQHQTKVDSLEAQQQSDIEAHRTQSQSETETLRAQHQAEVESLKSQLQADVGEMRTQHEAEIGSLREQTQSEAGALKTQHQAELARQRQANRELRDRAASAEQVNESHQVSQMLCTTFCVSIWPKHEQMLRLVVLQPCDNPNLQYQKSEMPVELQMQWAVRRLRADASGGEEGGGAVQEGARGSRCCIQSRAEAAAGGSQAGADAGDPAGRDAHGVLPFICP